MKILITHEHFLPDFRGGGETVVFETARHLVRAGFEVSVLTTGDPSITSYEGIATRRLAIHPYLFNFAVPSMLRAARHADLIHTFTYHAALPALVSARISGKPVVCTVMGLFRDAWLDMKGPLAGRLFSAWERVIVGAAYDKTSFPSDFARDIGLACGADEARSMVNSPGIALDKYLPAAHKQDTVLFVGKFEMRKGVNDVLFAARHMPDVQFKLIGWGPEEDNLRKAALPNMEVLVVPAGSAKRDAAVEQVLRDAYAQARIFLFPSRAETFGLVLVEAMASGCAIASSVPLHFAGIRFPQSDRDALMRAVRELWADREMTARMGEENLAIASQYTWERYTQTLIESYQAVLAGR